MIYEHIKSAINAAAMEALGEQAACNNNKKFWWNNNLQEQKNQKQKLYFKWLQTKQDADYLAYKHQRAKFKKIILEEKNNQWEKQCQELESYIGGRRTSESWKFITSIQNNKETKLKLNVIAKDSWKEYFEKMLNEHRDEYKLQPEELPFNLEGEKINIELDQLKTAITQLKNIRSAGPGGIPNELIKCGTPKLHNIIKTLFENCINGQQIPQEWNEGWITQIHKKAQLTYVRIIEVFLLTVHCIDSMAKYLAH
ncbi:uncharacterized protein LOC115887297 [Sitophilus oryzae]|uniref:Uncharacterized protein LOC115887297 n=1 Tax=Sitophilus oryzae TaxID=7048 RepID=A0A6J2YHF9_SITOR|nr:uncharacterized protein LOC115887297 [Sitophilus oryzae]